MAVSLWVPNPARVLAAASTLAASPSAASHVPHIQQQESLMLGPLDLAGFALVAEGTHSNT